MASAALIRSIYAMGTSLGINGNSREDNLHQLVYGMTGKESIKSLTDPEAARVRSELMEMMKGTENIRQYGSKKKPIDIPPGKMTEGQQNKAWQLIYKLCEIDPSNVPAPDRMKGAARKILDRELNMNSNNPFRMISVAEGSRFIDTLKKYVESAERKAKRNE